MQDTLEILEKREAHVLRLIAKEVETARTHQAANRKREALEAIKRKRMHDKEIERISGEKMNLMQTEQTLQQLRVHSIVHDAQLEGAKAIEREIQRVGGVDAADQLKDKLEDLLADTSELLDSSSRVIGEAGAHDEADLLEELEQLELEHELTETATETVPSRVVPQPVPLFDPAKERRAAKAKEEREAEERELSELAAKMNVEQAMPMPMQAACY